MPEPRPNTPSMRDVADYAGVSHQTVSRVINNGQYISATTREKVLKAIADLNYRPNVLARALATARSQRIGVIIDSPSQYGPMSTLRGVESAARDAGYSSSTVTVSRVEEEGFGAALDFLVGQDIDALCIVAPRVASLEKLHEQQVPLPTVVIGATLEHGASIFGEQVLFVGVDQHKGACDAVKYLIGQGHQKIAHIAGPLDWFDARGRSEAWRSTLEEAGLEAIPPITGDWGADSGYAAAEQITQLAGVTAVFAANDQMALGLVHGLTERGLVVPRDISVVGFDDTPESRHFLPPLTTVQQNYTELGKIAVDLLLSLLNGQAAEKNFRIDPLLVIRESVAPLGGRD